VEEVNLLIYDKSNRPNAEMFWGDAVYITFCFLRRFGFSGFLLCAII
jgi:hypothetical protein